MKAYFVSDIHLKSASEPNAQKLERLLRSILDSRKSGAPDAATHLFLVGDIFDLWIGGHQYFREKFEAITDLVRELVTHRVEVHFFEGNHDLHLESFWAEEIGVQVHPDAEYFQLGQFCLRVEHGDLMNPEDHGYLFLRKFLRRAWMKKLALNLPSAAVAWIGERASRASRTYTSTAKELPNERILQVIRRHAEAAYRERPFDLLIAGHVHVRDDFKFQVGERSVRSVNLGSWFHDQQAFVFTEPESARFVNLD